MNTPDTDPVVEPRRALPPLKTPEANELREIARDLRRTQARSLEACPGFGVRIGALAEEAELRALALESKR